MHAKRGSSDGGQDLEVVLEVAREVKDSDGKRVGDKVKGGVDSFKMSVFESLLAPDLVPRTHVYTDDGSISSHYNLV